MKTKIFDGLQIQFGIREVHLLQAQKDFDLLNDPEVKAALEGNEKCR